MAIIKLIFMILKKIICFMFELYLGVIAHGLIWIGGFFLFGFLGVMITGRVTFYEILYDHAILFVFSLLMVIIGIVLETWLIKRARKKKGFEKIKKFIRKLTRKEN